MSTVPTPSNSSSTSTTAVVEVPLTQEQQQQAADDEAEAIAQEKEEKALAAPTSNALLISGGLLCFYGLTTAMTDVMSIYLNLTPGTLAYYSFTTGFFSAGLVGAGVAGAFSSLALRPEPVYKRCIALLRKDHNLRYNLGCKTQALSEIKSSSFKAYRFDDGFFDRSRFRWQPARLRMAFNVQGPTKKGVVVVEAEKHRFTTIVNYLGVDIDDGERVVVVGEPNAEVDDIRSQLVFDEKAPPRK